MIKKKLPEECKKRFAEYGLVDIDLANISLLCVKKDEFICREGYPMLYLIIIMNGKAKVCINASNGKSLLFAFYTSSGILGEVELMTNGVASTSVQAITDISCIGIPLKHYQNYLKSNIIFMNYIGATLANKLDRCTRNSALNILHPLEARLCAYIALTNEDGYFKEKLTELADLLGTSYRHLLRTLEKLCEQDVLKKVSRGYLVKDKSVLQLKAGGLFLLGVKEN